MIYHDEKPSGSGFPIIVIVIAMAAIIGSLALMAGHPTTTTRVWVPIDQGMQDRAT